MLWASLHRPVRQGFVEYQIGLGKVSAALEKQEVGIFVDRKSKLDGNPLLRTLTVPSKLLPHLVKKTQEVLRMLRAAKK